VRVDAAAGRIDLRVSGPASVGERSRSRAHALAILDLIDRELRRA
jgi:hypothetical protein